MSAPHHRRFALFLAIVLIPGVVLIAVTVRLVHQERELAQQRRERSAELLAQQLGQELRLRLERLRDPARADVALVNTAVVLTARAVGTRLVLPWDGRTPASEPLRGSEADAALAAGAQAEFVDGRHDVAAAYYHEAAMRAAHPAARAEARLMAARATARAGQPGRAGEIYRALLAEPAALRDDDGLPYAVYAADALLGAGDVGADLVAALRRVVEAADIGPIALHAVADLSERSVLASDGAVRDSAAAVARTASAALRTVEQAATLPSEFPALRSLAAARRAGTADHETVWLPFGEEPWLVGIPTTAGPAVDTAGQAILVARPDVILAGIAVGGGPLAPAAAAARLDPHGTGPALGAVFPGVRVRFDDGFPPAEPAGLGAILLLFVLPVIAGALAFTAYLLWRDVRREVQAAALRSQFVASVSHELKTPLTSIRMFTELLRLGHVPADRQDEYLEIIGGETERLTRLINNVLDLSRIEREGRPYRREPVSLCDVVHDAARVLAYPLAQDGFELRLDVDADTPAIACDRDAITQAVLNLLSNAVKFSGTSRVVELGLARGNGNAVIRVSDRGRGIEPAEQQAIFRTFYRSPAAEAAGIPGTGIGLALVAHVAAGHGGRVDVESEPGRGSTFSLVLPLEAA
jgi:two-component system, OmpR family, phosphate regulon sensor histidine kinase PhoR